jgi:type IV secretory pathway TraG/TraD family ATPase VirD4
MPKIKFTELSSKLSRNGTITKDEHLDNIKIIETCGAIGELASARFSTIFESELGYIFDESGIDISRAIEQNMIMLFILNPLIYPELSELIGKLIMIDSKKAVSSLYTERKERTFFIFDEINVYAGKPLLNIVNKSRSANVTCVLASQSLSDLEENGGEYFKNQVIENCNNYLILRQNESKNAEAWANNIGTEISIKPTWGYDFDDNAVNDKGSLRQTREYIFHPDDIKNLPSAKGFYVSKERGKEIKTIIDINKPF